MEKGSGKNKKNHCKSTQHKSTESARARFLQRAKDIDVMLDSSREEELTRKQREIETIEVTWHD